MAWPRFAFQSPSDSWMWWAYQEIQGRAYAGRSKYQRERWHLSALHNRAVLDSAALTLARAMSKKHGRADVRLGSIWVDHTPQARASYQELGKKKSIPVRCELADLVIVTMASFGGRAPRQEDVRAVLVQAKVTTIPGELDLAGPTTSSFKERNLLECCNSKIGIWTGTGKSTQLGTFDLGSSPSKVGLADYSQYLTIPSKIDSPPVSPYQSMWPSGRAVENGAAISLGDALVAMLDPSSTTHIGCPLAGKGVKPDWPRLIRTLTRFYDGRVVDRFTNNGAAPISRMHESRVHSCFAAESRALFQPRPRNLLWTDMSFAFDGGGGRGHDDPSFNDDEDSGPRLPVLLIQVDLGPPGYESELRAGEN